MNIINSIIPILNGNKYPEELKESKYGPDQPAKSKYYGPKVMAKPRDLILLYIGKRITTLKDDYGEKIDNLVYFSAYNINRIATYDRFHTIDYDHFHAHHRYLKYEKEGLIDTQVSKKPKKGYVFALTVKGEQYCNTKIDDYLRRVHGKRPEIVSLPRGFEELQKELYHSYGLNWLPRDYFESHKSGSNDLDKWRKGFPFELPSIRTKQELRREGIIHDIKTKLENEKKILIIGESGSSKSTILMELMCDYFDAGYEIFHNIGISELKNIDGLVNFIEGRLKMKEKILVAVDDAHNEGTNSIFYVVDKLANSNLTKYLRFIITARIAEFRRLRSALGGVHEELRKSIRKLTDEDMKFIYRLPYFTKAEIRDFIKLYLRNIDDGAADKLSQEVYNSTNGDPIMVRFAVLGQGLEYDVKEMNDRYLGSQQEMKTMLICSLLDVSNIPITDKRLELCRVLESAYHLNGSILYRNTESLWKTKHARWDQELFSFLYGNNTTTTLPVSRKQDLKDSLVAIYEMREETVAYSAIMTLYDMASRNFVPIDLFEVVFKESISRKPLLLSSEKVSNIFVLISDAYYVLKDFRGAFDNSNEALTWNSDNAMAYMNKGIALAHLGRNDEGVEYLDKALDLDRGLARAWQYKGFALFHLGRYKEASVYYDKALEIDPNNLSCLVGRGTCFEMMGEHEKAIECYDYVLNQDELNKSLELKLVERLPLEALDLRDEYILNIDMQTSYILSLKSTSLLSVGKSDEAIKCIDKALQINPNETNALYYKGNILVKLGKYGEAVDVWMRKGNVHCSLGKYSEAVGCYDRVLELDSNRAEAWHCKGQALLRLARGDAQYCLDKAKKLGFNISSLEKKN